MAITSYENLFDKNVAKASCSKSSNLNAFSSMKIGCTTNTSLASCSGKYNKPKQDKYISPYLSDDRIKLLSRVTEKRFLHKNNDYMSSFPLAVNIYKANSDDLRSSKRCSKKVKKSVHTLPNERAPLPQACTVSDMNDSEYFNDDKDEAKTKVKKRRAVQTKSKSRVKNRQNYLYNTNLKNYSQLDKCSTEMISFTGIDKKKSKNSQNGKNMKSQFNSHDVWSLLRSVNQFKFRPSPPVSQESSVISIKKNKRRKNKKQRNIRKDTRLIESCRTEEFAFISSFVDDSRNSCSQTSFDRITVIEKQDEIKTIKCNGEENEFDKSIIPYNFYCSNELTRNTDKIMKLKSKIKALDVEKSIDNIFNFKKLGPPIIHRNDKTLQDRNKKRQNNELNNDRNNFIQMNFNNEIGLIQRDKDLDNHSNFSEKSASTRNNVMKIKNKLNPSKIFYGKLSPNNSQQHVTGITKVVLSKGENILSTKQVTSLQRKMGKPRTMLTLSEIKRRISSLKFPLVILGKDQLSSTFTVENYDPPQFAGLDDHIWPFMRVWYDKEYEDSFDSENCKPNHKFETMNFKNDVKSIKNKTKVYSCPKDDSRILKDKYDTLLSLPVKDNKLKNTKTHIKPMRRIKNSMMQLVNKKIAHENEISNSKCEQKHFIKLVDVGTNTENYLILPKRDNVDQISKTNTKIPQKVSSKRKWTSEFIENIIRKLKKGVYYYQDDKDEFKGHSNYTKEDGVQTETDNVKCQPDFNNVKAEKSFVPNAIDSVASIPGFDNQLTDLEIETLNNFNRVAVKHCVTNIIIQFDVALSFESNRLLQIKQSYSCIPVSLVKNQPSIFKCKRTIINAILPAELCSILPTLMRKVIHSNSKFGLTAALVDKTNSHLSTISEFNRYDGYLKQNFIPHHIDPKSKSKFLYTGHFPLPKISYKIEKCHINLELQPSSDLDGIKILLNPTSISLLTFDYIEPIHFLNHNNKAIPKQCQLKEEQLQDSKGLSTALQLYDYFAKQIISLHEHYSFMHIVENILRSENVRLISSAASNNSLQIVFYTNNLNTNFTMPDISPLGSTNLNVKIVEFQNYLDDHTRIVNKGSNSSILNTDNTLKAITNNGNFIRTSKSDKRKSAVEFCVNSKNKKRGFIKLYKKCKSMSSLSANRSSMNLDKISNLEEFYLALGSGKMLSGVLDGNMERKILSSIREMKNWMTDITPRQALLVLLLANKKDTTNLVRYRPIVLQGIAVNRITRASELDMEIEVIERENLNKLTQQYEGITYLPASEENQDNLFEELCWIAKTTASDYQKPFDGSSERLLKSLLEKRKKLNPSYLRVMARYVGLGLLKTSK